MHISEGVLAAPVLAGGGALALAGLVVGLKKLEPETIPRVAVLSSTFFVGSLIHLPVGGVSLHLVLNGLCGLLLGWLALPSLLVGLALQALLFQYGGLTVLGVNTLVMGAPAVAAHYLFKNTARADSPTVVWLAGFGTGLVGVGGGTLLIGGALALSGEAFMKTAIVAMSSHLPVILVEGVATGFVLNFLRKVKPALLAPENLTPEG